jgi:hypothetical protein
VRWLPWLRRQARNRAVRPLSRTLYAQEREKPDLSRKHAGSRCSSGSGWPRFSAISAIPLPRACPLSPEARFSEYGSYRGASFFGHSRVSCCILWLYSDLMTFHGDANSGSGNATLDPKFMPKMLNTQYLSVSGGWVFNSIFAPFRSREKDVVTRHQPL